MTSLSVGQILLDAQRMTNRVKDLDALSTSLLIEAEGNNRIVESLRQFQEDVDSLNRLSNNKTNAEMVNRIQQQNANSSEIMKENRELKVCLEDYERAMELMMHKYREHATKNIFESKISFKENYNEKLWKIIREQRDKINEMAAVMQHAASVDDQNILHEVELISRLRLENKSLRELLQISKSFGSEKIPICFNERKLEEKAVQTDAINKLESIGISSIEYVNNNSCNQNTIMSVISPSPSGNKASKLQSRENNNELNNLSTTASGSAEHSKDDTDLNKSLQIIVNRTTDTT